MSETLQSILAEAAARHGLTGAQIAFDAGRGIETASWGLSDRERGTRMDDATLMPIGSVSKLLASALCLRLVDLGLADLDRPVQSVLADFSVDDAKASATITPRHLLTHRAGFDGDWFADTGSGPDAMAKYVRSLSDLKQIVPPGTHHSYCNAGFAVIGRLCEVLTNQPWSEAINSYLLEPMGLDSLAAYWPDRIGTHLIGCGHGPDGQALKRMNFRGHAPAGPGPVASMYALLELINGMKDYLSPYSFAGMTQRQVEGPCTTFASAWGLGTMLFDLQDGSHLWGHDGALPGVFTYLRRHEPTGVALATVASGGNAAEFAAAVMARLLYPAIGASPVQSPEPDNSAKINPQNYVGTYSLSSARLEVLAAKTGLDLTSHSLGPSADLVPTLTLVLHPIDEERMLAHMPGRSSALIQRFTDFDTDGRPQLLNFRGRLFPRQTPETEKAA